MLIPGGVDRIMCVLFASSLDTLINSMLPIIDMSRMVLLFCLLAQIREIMVALLCSLMVRTLNRVLPQYYLTVRLLVILGSLLIYNFVL
jgi:hypothetical protein